MSPVMWRRRVLAGGILAALMGAAPTASTEAQEKAAAPDFSSDRVFDATIAETLARFEDGKGPAASDG